MTRKRKIELLCSGIVLAPIVACLSYVGIVHVSARYHVYALARQLGYTDAAFISLDRHCVGIWGMCGYYLHYRSNLTVDQFTSNINTIERGSIHYGGAGYPASLLLSDINGHTLRVLTVDGKRTYTSVDKEPRVDTWSSRDPYNRLIEVIFYTIPHNNAQYALDGVPFQENIVTVEVRTSD